MLILALDTTTRAGSVAITDDDRLLAVQAGDSTRTHGERLPGELDAVLRAARIERSALDLLVVASGPGAFTGLRIGLAAMQGLAMTLGRPIIAVSALDALAWTALASEGTRRLAPLEEAPSRVVTWMDAARGEVFGAVYRRGPEGVWPWRVVAEPAVGALDVMLGEGSLDRAEPTVFVGDGARRYADTIGAVSTQWIVSPDDPPLAPALAWIGRRLAAEGHAGAPHALQPLYVRRPDAEIERDRLVHGPVRRSSDDERGAGRRSPEDARGPVRRSPEGEGGS